MFQNFYLDESVVISDPWEWMGGISSTDSEIDFQMEGVRYLGNMAKVIDDRSFAIIGSSVIEREVEGLISILVPKLKSDNLTFHSKIQLLKAWELIPHILLDNANFVRKIRNNFAHKLDSDSLESLDEHKFIHMRRCLSANFGHNLQKLQSDLPSVVFGHFVNETMAGIHSCRSGLKKIRAFIWENPDIRSIVTDWTYIEPTNEPTQPI